MTEVLIKKEKREDGSNIAFERRYKKEIAAAAKMRFVKSAAPSASSTPATATKGRTKKLKFMSATHDAAAAGVGNLKLQQKLQNKRKTTSPPATLAHARHFLPGARCGEIFVANNARQWTFICTFCNTSTRDIGDFISHIKTKHLQESEGYYYNNYDDANTDDIDNDDADDNYEQEQDYFDCGNYLDVSVHTDDPTESSYNNGQGIDESFSKSTSLSKPRTQQKIQKATSTSTGASAAAVTTTVKKIKLSAEHQQEPRAAPKVNNFVVDLVDDADDDVKYDVSNKFDIADNGASNEHDASYNYQQKFNLHASKQTAKKKTGHVKKIGKNAGAANGSTSVSQAHPTMDFDDYTNEQYQQTTSNNTTDEYGQPYDDFEDDEDFDNQLLIPNDSMDNSNMGNNSNDVKSKRRQIRGTAYCALCNKTFQYYSLYRNHMIKHSNETPFKCPLCKKGFKSKQAIRYHMNTHQKQKQFQCELCDNGYYTENQFITHVLTHESAEIFPCMVCGKILRSDKERDHHVATHTEERPFRCEFCNKLFRLRHHLSNHLKMHRQYRCDYCKEEFTSAVFLRKPYACPVCELSPETRKQLVVGEANPLQLFQTLRAPTECVDIAEMVTDESEGDDDDRDAKQHKKNDDNNDDDDDDDGDNDEEVVPQQQAESDQADDDVDGDDVDEDENDDNLLIPQSSRSSLMEATKYYKCKYCTAQYPDANRLENHVRVKHC